MNDHNNAADGEDLDVLALLGDDTRRRVYFAVRQAPQPLSRKDVAEQLNINPRLATFHLEKLLDAGLLHAHYERPPGRSGPGAGRPAKHYRPADVELAVTIPPRRYGRLSDLLVQAIAGRHHDETTEAAILRTARANGQADGTALRRRHHLRRPGKQRTLEVITDFLRRQGYEPYRVDDTVALGNCPFHGLAQVAPELVCATNHAYLDGVVDALGGTIPPPAVACRQRGDCCVEIGDVDR